MTTYTITVRLPKGAKYMNANDRPNRWAKAAQTKVWRAQAFAAACHSGGGLLTGLVRVTATVHIADKRRREVKP